jgi:hypothetical protein
MLEGSPEWLRQVMDDFPPFDLHPGEERFVHASPKDRGTL